MARSGSLLLVVIGHLAMAIIDRPPHGVSVRGANVLALSPRFEFLGLLSPMPMFFVAAGWAHAHSSPSRRMQQLTTIIGASSCVVVAWSLVSILEILITGKSGVIGDGARIATQPLWFLAAYVPFVAASHAIQKWSRHIPLLVTTCVTVVAVSDIWRFIYDAPRRVGFPGFFATWLIPWLLGTWWRHRYDQNHINERVVGGALVLVGLCASVALVMFAGYTPSLIDAIPGHRSNTTPPTVFTCCAAICQTGLLMVLARQFDTAATRWRITLQQLNNMSLGVYLWHLSGVVITAGFIALGVPVSVRFSATWWLSRLPWFACIALITTLFVKTTQILLERRGKDDATLSETSSVTHLGILIATCGAAITGLIGPRTIVSSLTMIGCFIGGWILLNSQTIFNRQQQIRQSVENK